MTITGQDAAGSFTVIQTPRVYPPRRMRIKFTVASRMATLAGPLVGLGDNADASVQVREITDIPPEVHPSTVLRDWEQTVIWDCPRLSFRYAEIEGGGKIIVGDK